jgi:NAD(P)-dependent dehydrogenase (short-subunit alcohol dehydrogenase family)
MAEALIWGASGGIGSALALLLKERQWRVFAAARDESRIPAGMDATYAFDAGDPFTFDAASMAVAQSSDGIDLAVYAAGVMQAQPITGFEPEQWRAVMDANLNGAFLAAKASANVMREGGSFMIIGAHVDKVMLPRFGAYAAAKAALEPLVHVLGKEQRKFRFVLVRPGAVDTPFWANVPFRLPAGAASARAVAEAILAGYEGGHSGALDV